MKKLSQYISKEAHIAPLVVFRLVFGFVMFFSVLRFALKGWIYDQYIEPTFHFAYLGFSWVKPFSEIGMYAVFTLMAISFLCVALGLFYRVASISAFVLFTYVELLDKANYLNHYYFVSLVCFLLILVPAHRYFSLDVYRKPSLKLTHVPLWSIGVFKLQLGFVYFFAGIAKLNYEWLINANPLKIWLPAQSHLPIIGGLLSKSWVAYFASWFGAIYDLTVPFLLATKKYRPIAYFFVIVFHVSTSALFQIGVFPFVMIGATLIFFSEDFHIKILNKLEKLFQVEPAEVNAVIPLQYERKRVTTVFIVGFFAIQAVLPFRYALYPGELFWNEEGYRFSWRVMLMEKAGYTSFRIVDAKSNRSWEAKNYEHLTPNQEKMMSTQPDMILEYAHYLEEKAKEQGAESPEVYVDAFVSLNGQASRRFVNPEINLAAKSNSLKHKDWILPFE
jgi:hypothetical protein